MLISYDSLQLHIGSLMLHFSFTVLTVSCTDESESASRL